MTEALCSAGKSSVLIIDSVLTASFLNTCIHLRACKPKSLNSLLWLKAKKGKTSKEHFENKAELLILSALSITRVELPGVHLKS